MQHFSNYFVQILVIRSKCRGTDGPGGAKKFRGGSCSPGPYFSRLRIKSYTSEILKTLWQNLFNLDLTFSNKNFVTRDPCTDDFQLTVFCYNSCKGAQIKGHTKNASFWIKNSRITSAVAPRHLNIWCQIFSNSLVKSLQRTVLSK